MVHEEVFKQAKEWISPGAIADLLVEDVEERGLPVTFENVKKLWYATLEGLADLIKEVPDSRITEGQETAEQDAAHIYSLDGKPDKFTYEDGHEHDPTDGLPAHEEDRREQGEERGEPID